MTCTTNGSIFCTSPKYWSIRRDVSLRKGITCRRPGTFHLRASELSIAVSRRGQKRPIHLYVLTTDRASRYCILSAFGPRQPCLSTVYGRLPAPHQYLDPPAWIEDGAQGTMLVRCLDSTLLADDVCLSRGVGVVDMADDPTRR